MRVAVDARLAGRGLGISRFVHTLVTGLVDHVEVVWLGDPRHAPGGIAGSWRLDRLPYPAIDGRFGEFVARRTGADLVHFTGNTGWTSAVTPVPSVLTVHDVMPLKQAGGALRARQEAGRRYVRRNLPRAVRAAAEVAVPSRTAAAELAEFVGSAARPTVIPTGVAAPATTVERPAEPYVAAFGAPDDRKRLDLALAGWEAAGGVPGRLLIFGGRGLPRGFVARGAEVLPYLPREELWRKLAGASALVYPSTDEGFGLPVLEAMAAGVPVISGLAPATREICGEALIEIDASDPVTSIAAALRRLHEDPAAGERLRELGRSRAAGFTVDRMASGYLELYERAAGRTVKALAAGSEAGAP